MKKYIFLSFILLFLKSISAIAQVSPLFHTPSLGLNLPSFNPAFVGDLDRHRLYVIRTTLRPEDRSLNNNTSDIIGYDGKTARVNSTFQFTYGASLNHNKVSLTFNENDAVTFQQGDLKDVRFQYGTAEIVLGGRLAIGGRNRKLKKVAGSTKEQIARDNGNLGPDDGKDEDPKKQKKRNKIQLKQRVELDKDNATFLAPIDNSWVCSYNSSLDYLAMNFTVNYNYASLTGESGLVFGNQIVANQIGASTPFGIFSGVNDPSIPESEFLRTNNFDFGVGVLFHKVMNARTVLRLGYSYRNIVGGFTGVPESAQKNVPIQVLQLNVRKNFKKSGEFNFNILYLQQSREIFDVSLGQSRIEVFKKIDFNGYRNLKKSGFQITSMEPGLATYMVIKRKFDGSSPANNLTRKNVLSFPLASFFLGTHFQLYSKGKSRPTYTGGTKDRIVDYHLFFSWDIHTSRDLPFRETGGNGRVGLIISL